MFRATTLVALSAALSAQIAPHHVVVATTLPGAPTAALIEADLVTGAMTPLSRFPSDNFAPRQVYIDRVNRDLIVALDAGVATRLVRLRLRGRRVLGEQLLATVPGATTGLTQGVDEDLFVITGGPNGQLFRVPRTGGAPTVVTPIPYASAVTRFRFAAGYLLITRSGDAGPPVVDPGLTEIDLRSGRVLTHTWPGYTPRNITGIVDLPGIVQSQAISHDDGTLAGTVLFSTPQPFPLTPQLPPGATRALHSRPDPNNPLATLTLGGAAHPFLKDFSFVGGWINLVGPLPGDPVDFDAAGPQPAQVVQFGAACGSRPNLMLGAGTPTIGNQSFEIEMGFGVGGAFAGLVLGFDDRDAFGRPLPIPLPGNCPLLVDPLVVLPHVVNRIGRASQIIPIPNAINLQGTILFAQWIQGALTFATTPGAAIQIAR